MKGLKFKFWRLFKNYWPFFAILLIVATFFWKVFLQNKVPLPADFVVGVYYPWLDYKWEGFPAGVPVKNPITTDVVSFSYPMRILAVNNLKRGVIPLWNSYILAGTPLLANFQSAPFSPTNLVYFLFNNINGWTAQVILQHVLVIIFTYFLLRNWKVTKLSSIVGGVVFAFSGFNLIWSQWNAHVLTAAFIPLLLLFSDKWLGSGKPKYAAGVPICLFLQIVSGYPQLVFYSFVALFVLWIFRIKKDKTFIVRSVYLGLFLVIGLGLSAIQIFPASELLSLSQREVETHPFEWAFLPWSKTITFLAPDYFGNHATGNWWGPQDYTSNTGFVGVVAATLAINSFSLLKKRKEILFGFALTIISLVLSFPTPVAIFNWKSGIFGFQAASAHRGLVLFTLGISLLTAFGLDKLIKKNKFSFKALIIPWSILIGYCLYALFMYILSSNNPIDYPSLVRGIPKYVVALRNLIFPIGILFVISSCLVFIRKIKKIKSLALFFIITLLVFELFRFGWKFTPFSPKYLVYPVTPILEYLRSAEKPFRTTGDSVIPVNMRMAYGIESLEGYDAVYPLRISEFIAAINTGNTGTVPQGRYGMISNKPSSVLDIVNTKYYIVLKTNDRRETSPEGQIPWQFRLPGFTKVFEDRSVAILSSSSSLPRAFMVYDWQVVPQEKDLLKMILDGDVDFSKTALLENDMSVPKSNVDGDFSVSYTKYSDQESVISVETSENGLLFVSDSWYPGWKAFVDGEKVPIHLANYAFRAVELPKGTHEVSFVYKPESFNKGLKVTVTALVLFVIVLIAIGKKKTR